MESGERASKKAKFVQVIGLGGEWKFFAGTAVGEAARHIARNRGVDKEDLAIAAVTEEGEVVAGTELALQDDYQYVVRREGGSSGPRARTFAAGHAVNPREHYFVKPDVDLLVEDMKKGKYCVLCGPRQSGKTTAANVVMQRLRQETDIMPVFLEGLEVAARDWSPSDMWKYFWDCLHRSRCSLFRARPAENSSCLSVDFRALFLKEVLSVPVALVMDEADSLLLLPTGCVADFFHGIRTIKQHPEFYNLRSLLLVGVETVKDLLEGRYGQPGYRPGRCTPSRLSPFSHDHRLAPGAFTTSDVVCLLEQRNAEVDESLSVVRDVQEIAASIMSQTSGHKGLVGTCLAYLVREKAFDICSWRKLTSSYKLANHVFGQGPYSSMMQYFRSWALKSAGGYNLLVQFLEKGEQLFTEDALLSIRGLLAEGVLAVKEEVEDQMLVGISSPLLLTAILRKCMVVDQEVEAPPTQDSVDGMWLILQAIRTLEGDVVCRPQYLKASGGSSSEYSLQFVFMSRIKAVLCQAYPNFHCVVLPEAKEVELPGTKRSQMKLDVLVRDASLSKMAFELVVNATLASAKKHEEHLQKYYEQHIVQVFMINITNQPGGLFFGPQSDGFYSVLVEFHAGNNTATVKCMDFCGMVNVQHVPLMEWTGRLSFSEVA